jgi:hypothetical protein
MQLKQTYLLFLGLVLLSSITLAQNLVIDSSGKLLTTQSDFEVGSQIILRFSTKANNQPLLYCSDSYGSTLVSGSFKNNILEYVIPENIIKKIGVVKWTLLNDNNDTKLAGKFNINPIEQVTTMETYIGPSSIEAGGNDYTMLVVIPTDSLDNPTPKNTLVDAKYQFLVSEEQEVIYTDNLIAFLNINSKRESGRMLVSSESVGVSSNEFTINVMPAIPTDFNISATRPHDYADGNQVTTFSISIISDKQNNVVSDGTFVTFYIKNKKGNILKTTGTTINGIATSKMIHPDYADSWNVKAYIDGMSESNSISINYKQVIKDFNVSFSKDNRLITVGPLQSFMKQMIADGLHVKLHIYQNNTRIETLTKTSFNGYVSFKLKAAIYKNEIYDFRAETAGISKAFKAIKLW